MTTARTFRGFRFPAEVILWAGRWYLQFPVSYQGRRMRSLRQLSLLGEVSLRF